MHIQRWASAAAVPLTEPIEAITPPAGTRKAPEDVKVCASQLSDTRMNTCVFCIVGNKARKWYNCGITGKLFLSLPCCCPCEGRQSLREL